MPVEDSDCLLLVFCSFGSPSNQKNTQGKLKWKCVNRKLTFFYLLHLLAERLQLQTNKNLVGFLTSPHTTSPSTQSACIFWLDN
jgi:hypothetical protein